ncbi:MAG: hypothetical protein IJ024_01180 [Lachnospiraceae bacterium]|nr:hypothetical protein [Lachnospiraceae bacterium]
MYLISVYFDETTERRIKSYIKQIAKYTGNTAMLDGNVPPHITISAFQTESEESAKKIFQKTAGELCAGDVQWVSVGSFLRGTIYITPVLNEYLHQLSVIYNKEATSHKEVQIDKRYQPFQWLPHTTLAKCLTKEQLQCAFQIMQNQFGPFCGKVVKIGLAKTNPYNDVMVLELK